MGKLGGSVDPVAEGKLTQARDSVKKLSLQPRFYRALLEAVVGLRPQQELDRISIQTVRTALEKGDPEAFYQTGSILAYAGKEDDAVTMIRSAIEGNYCAYNPLADDPLLVKLRATSAFRRLLEAARSCQEPVLACGLLVRIDQPIGIDIPQNLQSSDGFITFLSRQPLSRTHFSVCDSLHSIRISMKTNWRKRVRVERTDDIRDAVRRF